MLLSTSIMSNQCESALLLSHICQVRRMRCILQCLGVGTDDRRSNGDLNFLGPFIPFASPMEINWLRSMMPRWKAAKEAAASGQVAPPMRPTMKGRLTGNDAFKQVLQVFEKHEVGVVVRLNDEL